jgi:hypothetical protein
VDYDSLRNVLEDNFQLVPDRCTQTELVIVCPEDECGDRTGNRTFNSKIEKTNCWRCGKAYNIRGFLREHGLPWEEEDESNLNGKSELLAVEQEIKEVAIHQNGLYCVRFPQSSHPLSPTPQTEQEWLISDMAERKHLTYDDFVAAGVHTTRDPYWEKYAIFPVYEFGNLVIYQGRTYRQEDEGGTTKMFPSKKYHPMGSKYWLYNIDKAHRAKSVIVVESILNVLSLQKEIAARVAAGATDLHGVVPVAVFRHHISDQQRMKLEILEAGDITFMYDDDATADAWKQSETLRTPSYVVEMPKGVDANDDPKSALDLYLGSRKKCGALASLDAMLDGL